MLRTIGELVELYFTNLLYEIDEAQEYELRD